MPDIKLHVWPSIIAQGSMHTTHIQHRKLQTADITPIITNAGCDASCFRLLGLHQCNTHYHTVISHVLKVWNCRILMAIVCEYVRTAPHSIHIDTHRKYRLAYVYMHMHTHRHTHMHTHKHMQEHMYAHTHAREHTRTTRKCTHTHTIDTLADTCTVRGSTFAGADPGFCKGGHKIFHCSFTITTSSVNKHAVTL